jgi:hypothetical protein
MHKTIVAASLAVSAALLGGCAAAGSSFGGSGLPSASQNLRATNASNGLQPVDSVGGGLPAAQHRPKHPRRAKRPFDSVGGGLPAVGGHS